MLGCSGHMRSWGGNLDITARRQVLSSMTSRNDVNCAYITLRYNTHPGTVTFMKVYKYTQIRCTCGWVCTAHTISHSLHWIMTANILSRYNRSTLRLEFDALILSVDAQSLTKTLIQARTISDGKFLATNTRARRPAMSQIRGHGPAGAIHITGRSYMQSEPWRTSSGV